VVWALSQRRSFTQSSRMKQQSHSLLWPYINLEIVVRPDIRFRPGGLPSTICQLEDSGKRMHYCSWPYHNKAVHHWSLFCCAAHHQTALSISTLRWQKKNQARYGEFLSCCLGIGAQQEVNK
jgi:hypothetical protein